MTFPGPQTDVPGICRVATVALIVRDYGEAIAWYTEVLGFTVTSDVDQGEGKRWVTVAPPGGGAQLLLAQAAKPKQKTRIGDQTGGRVFLFLETTDFQDTHRRLTARGVGFRERPREEAYGTVAVFADLYGNLWDLVEPKR